MMDPRISRIIKNIGVQLLKLGMAFGVFGVLITTAYNFIVGDVSIRFDKPYGRYYAFTMENDSPSDQIIENFKVIYPEGQPLVGRTTRAIYADKVLGKGVTLPGGNIGWIPTVEFSELDGREINAGKTLKFRLPPSSSIDYIELEAAIFDLVYRTHPTNGLLAHMDSALKWIGLRSNEIKTRYVMVDNYWSPTSSNSMNEALRIACRNDRSLSRGYNCP